MKCISYKPALPNPQYIYQEHPATEPPPIMSIEQHEYQEAQKHQELLVQYEHLSEIQKQAVERIQYKLKQCRIYTNQGGEMVEINMTRLSPAQTYAWVAQQTEFWYGDIHQYQNENDEWETSTYDESMSIMAEYCLLFPHKIKRLLVEHPSANIGPMYPAKTNPIQAMIADQKKVIQQMQGINKQEVQNAEQWVQSLETFVQGTNTEGIKLHDIDAGDQHPFDWIILQSLNQEIDTLPLQKQTMLKKARDMLIRRRNDLTLKYVDKLASPNSVSFGHYGFGHFSRFMPQWRKPGRAIILYGHEGSKTFNPMTQEFNTPTRAWTQHLVEDNMAINDEDYAYHKKLYQTTNVLNNRGDRTSAHPFFYFDVNNDGKITPQYLWAYLYSNKTFESIIQSIQKNHGEAAHHRE